MKYPMLVGVVALGLAGALAYDTVRAEPTDKAETKQAAAKPEKSGDAKKMEKATFGGGCFWGVEAAFRQLNGVKETAVGYEGGNMDNPSYKDVCTDRTGHVEVVQVTFDPDEISYDELLKVFWDIHDPTQVNRQGPDVGTQYRSVIFYNSPEQKEAAEKSKKALDDSKTLKRPVATAIEPAKTFWMAEDYHQQYLEKRGLSSCHVSLKE